MRKLTHLSLGLLICVQLGCEPAAKSTNSSSSSKSTTAPAVTASPEAVRVMKVLEEAGATLTKSASGQVTQVAFRDKPITDELAVELAKLQAEQPVIQNLILSASDMKVAGWQEIGKLSTLKQLDIRECRLADPHFKAAVSGLNELVSLRMSGKNGETTVSDEGLVALKGCPKLRVLAGDFLFISDVGLAELSGLTELRELYLASSLVDDAALERIASMPSVAKLRIAKTSVSKEGLEKLTKLKLEELDISECSKLDDAALEPVGKMISLKKLNLWRDAVGDTGVAWLAPLVNLEWLNVDNTQLTDAGLKSFAKFDKLTFLHLGSTAVSDAGMPDLLPLKSLNELKVTRTSVTEAGVDPLRKAMPKLDIQLKYGEP